MIHIRNLSDCHLLTHAPELQREVISYLLYCHHDLQEYEDEDDIDDFDFKVLAEEDLPVANAMLNDLGTPEETVQINIQADGHTITIHRIVYPTEVLFIHHELYRFMNIRCCDNRVKQHIPDSIIDYRRSPSSRA